MLGLSQQNDVVTVIAESTDVYLDCCDGNNVRSYLPPQARKKKILEIRQQIIEGRYDIDRRLVIALDRLLEDFVA